MSIEVRFFARLREVAGRDGASVEATPGMTARQAWERTVDGPLPAHTLVAINMEYARLDDAVADGDEVAFFPPVTGG